MGRASGLPREHAVAAEAVAAELARICEYIATTTDPEGLARLLDALRDASEAAFDREIQVGRRGSRRRTP